MESPLYPSIADIVQVGPVARACLVAGKFGRVLATFSKAIYLVDESGELFWLANKMVPMHQRCAQVIQSLPHLPAGTPFYVDKHRLIVDTSYIFDLEAACDWQEPPLRPERVIGVERLFERIHSLIESLDLSEARGFGNFIVPMLELSKTNSCCPAPTYKDPLLLYAAPRVLEMGRACLEGQVSRIAHIAGSIIGLGEGLTPSGDDYLGGMMFAMKCLQQAYPGLNFGQIAFPIETYRSKTNEISFIYLRDLANGHAAEPLHHTASGLLAHRAIERIYPSIIRLTHTGHSTGWDLLSGLLSGLLTVTQSHCLTPV